MSSLKERIELLESDLKAVPLRISVYHDLPFAILRRFISCVSTVRAPY
jgi:hypothetical protein